MYLEEAMWIHVDLMTGKMYEINIYGHFYS